jgi:cell division protein FtsI/penicillin-binding protein 2
VAGKTGTAEFGAAPPKAHSWFTGYQGDLAFAVFVYGGQTGGTLANPIARDFLARVPR